MRLPPLRQDYGKPPANPIATGTAAATVCRKRRHREPFANPAVNSVVAATFLRCSKLIAATFKSP
jgi:hypothetical protein